MRYTRFSTNSPPLASLSDRELLALRLCDLGVLKTGIESTWIQPHLERLQAELTRAGLRHVKPNVYFGDEWFSPDGVPAIAVPFYLAHPRLRRLEQAMMHEVEGGSPLGCMQLLRHEAGHCFDHAYEISRRRGFRQIFGNPPRRYDPDIFLPDRRSRAHVRHLPGYYAQAHPDEDFAETFAIVVTPGFDWRRRYSTWPEALAKLTYVQDLISTLGPRRPDVLGGPDSFNAARMRTTLARHYEKRRASRVAQELAVKKLAEHQPLPFTSRPV